MKKRAFPYNASSIESFDRLLSMIIGMEETFNLAYLFRSRGKEFEIILKKPGWNMAGLTELINYHFGLKMTPKQANSYYHKHYLKFKDMFKDIPPLVRHLVKKSPPNESKKEVPPQAEFDSEKGPESVPETRILGSRPGSESLKVGSRARFQSEIPAEVPPEAGFESEKAPSRGRNSGF